MQTAQPSRPCQHTEGEGRTKTNTSQAANCIEELPKHPNSLPAPCRDPRALTLHTNNTAPHIRAPRQKATVTTHSRARRSHPRAQHRPLQPPPAPGAPSAGAVCCAPCPRAGRPCSGAASPRAPPRRAPAAARPRGRGCPPAAPTPPSSRRPLRLRAGDTRLAGERPRGWVSTAPASLLPAGRGQRGPARGALLGRRGGERAGLIFRV